MSYLAPIERAGGGGRGKGKGEDLQQPSKVHLVWLTDSHAQSSTACCGAAEINSAVVSRRVVSDSHIFGSFVDGSKLWFSAGSEAGYKHRGAEARRVG